MKFIQFKMLLPANYCLTCTFYFTIRLSKCTYDITIHTCMQEVLASYLDGNTNQTHIFHGFPSILLCKCCSKATDFSFLILPSSFPIIHHYTVRITGSYVKHTINQLHPQELEILNVLCTCCLDGQLFSYHSAFIYP
jgi:hypothetical protein